MLSFLGSLVILFQVKSGFPLSNKFCPWILCLVMSATVICLGYTFLSAMRLVVPDRMQSHYQELSKGLHIVWTVTAGIVRLFLLVRMCPWLKRFVHKDASRRLLKLGPDGRANKPEPLC
ncbi:hypothetical protein CDL15_Pgr003436 [Punica granatum]|uniref:PGG domain-containing protein n=1 Tax=Punica granatum TaxID=22663 RepID=A0A218X2V6_PUNGR|nr:hypothetical protein CDL15_Pgr003436 [Punica granatum]